MRKAFYFVSVAQAIIIIFLFIVFFINNDAQICKCGFMSNDDKGEISFHSNNDINESDFISNKDTDESCISYDNTMSTESDFTEDDIVGDDIFSEDTDISIKKIIDVPSISQYPKLPTGCEAVAATMVLLYWGVDITAQYFAENWLECSESFFNSGGKLYGPDPNEVFAGNPFTKNSYGCYATPIVNAINRNSKKVFAEKFVDKSLEELCSEYIDNDMPLLIWATMSMKESSQGNSWYLKDGRKFTWTAGEHCLVLVGYDEEYYFLNDPMSGSTVGYQKNVVEQRFAELGMQAVCVYPQ